MFVPCISTFIYTMDVTSFSSTYAHSIQPQLGFSSICNSCPGFTFSSLRPSFTSASSGSLLKKPPRCRSSDCGSVNPTTYIPAAAADLVWKGDQETIRSTVSAQLLCLPLSSPVYNIPLPSRLPISSVHSQDTKYLLQCT